MIEQEPSEIDTSESEASANQQVDSIADDQVELDMAVRKVVTNENVKANDSKIAFERGPIVYCAEAVDNPKGVFKLEVEKSKATEYIFDQSTLNGVGKIIGKQNLVPIRYYFPLSLTIPCTLHGNSIIQCPKFGTNGI